MKNFFVLLTVWVLGFHTLSASATFLELRANAGFQFVDPFAMNDFLSTQDVKQIYILPLTGFTAYFRPSEKFGVGAQWDSQSIKVNSSNNSSMGNAKYSGQRISVKGFYHVVERVFITGPTAAVGVNHQISINGRNSAGVAFDYDKAKETSMSLGWELGAKFPVFMFGGEVGYQHHMIKSLKGPTGDATFKVNMSGPYMTGFVGLNF